jgi:predicted nucleotidyltransferase component of viral defense system
VVADNYIEAFAEKFRALTRPRDFYDVLKLYRNIDVRKEPSGVR